MSMASQSPRPGGGNQFGDAEFDLPALGAALWRNKWQIVRPTVLAALIAIAVVEMILPKYLSEARVLIEGATMSSCARSRQGSHRPRHGRSGGGDQPGAAHPFARSRQRGDRQAQARRTAGVRSGDCRDLAAQEGARLHRRDQEPAAHDAGRARARCLLRPAPGLPGGEVARHRHRLSVGGSRARRRVANAIADAYLVRQQAAKQRAGARRRRMARPARSKPCARRSPTPKPRWRRSAPTPISWSAPTIRRSPRSSSATSTRSSPPRARRRPTPQSKAKLIREMLRSGGPLEFVRHSQFRADPPAVRAARHLARAARRAVVVAARQSSAHQGAQGADRRPRQADQGRGGHAGAFVGKRCQARRRARRYACRKPRSAQEPGGWNQRAGRAAARARARRQIAARSARILSRQIPRGDRARHHQFGAGRRPRDFARHGLERSRLSEKAADRADRVAGGDGALFRLGAYPRASRRSRRRRASPLPQRRGPPPARARDRRCRAREIRFAAGSGARRPPAFLLPRSRKSPPTWTAAAVRLPCSAPRADWILPASP